MSERTSDDAVERTARARLRADEEAATRRRSSPDIGETFRAFWRHPSPWMIAATLLALAVARLVVGSWRLDDIWGPLVFVALFPAIEWVIHVFILHWRPRRVGPVMVDTLLAREHRRHHADPREVPLVFVPWRALVVTIVVANAIPLLAFPRLGQGLSFDLTMVAALFVYEWTHYLIHSDYKPKSVAYKAIWRNHRLHHYKNEHYWFSITTSGTSDRLFRTYPAQGDVETSGTAKNLHGAMD